MISYFLFYVLITNEIIKQVWLSTTIDRNVIIGLISGYVSLGLIGFFICLSVELTHPGSFNFPNLGSGSEFMVEDIMYFSYMTLITIGYGDIYPITVLAKKAAILIGLSGQFYLVIITAIVVGKYLNQLQHTRESN
ncbi:MAG: two pore domain potassium channel family protein [Flavobacteriaceae bacterium]|nr:two pore domain potassium channel family protein [Flavobacteriaceae bacterium]